MNVAAETYNTFNKLQFKLAQILIDKINLYENESGILDLVVDIGSGSGNVTAKFAENLNYKRLVGLDIDPKMIEFAKKNNTKEKIDFLECDFEMPWDQLAEEVKKLQGKCSMAYSSTAMHWMSNVGAVANNISQLLAPGSRIFILMLNLDDVFCRLDKHDDEFYSILPLFKGDNFINKWKEELERQQIRVESIETVALDLTITEPEFVNMWCKMGKAMLNKYLPKHLKVEEFLKKFPEIVHSIKSMNYRPTGQLADDGEELWTKDFYYWVIVATKL